MRKNYVSVYTCAVSRAVHLDTVPDLTAEAFVDLLLVVDCLAN